MDLAEKKLAMFNTLLKGNDLQRTLDVAAGVLDNPIALFDTSNTLVAVSTKLLDDPIWSPATFDPDKTDLAKAVKSGDMRRMLDSDTPVLADYRGSAQRYLSARMRRGDKLLGSVVVLERNHKFTHDDRKLLPDICKAIVYYMSYNYENFDQISENYGRLLMDILERFIQDPAEIETRAKLARLKVPAQMRLLVARYVRDDNMIAPDYLRTITVKLLPGAMAVVFGENVVCIYDASFHTFEDLLEKNPILQDVCMGVSLPFAHLADMNRAYEQAIAAIRLTILLRPQQNVFWYERVVARHLLECAEKSCDAATFQHPALELLAQADERDGSDRLRDLEAYLFCGRNAALTAQTLHVHKNTMYYRLQRIEEIAGVDLSDEGTCFALQLGLVMLGHLGI